MSIICAVAGHKASTRTVWNEGTHFSKCARCALDLVELQGRWEPPPPWFKVVWKKRPEPAEVEIAEATLELTAEDVCAKPVPEVRRAVDRRAGGSEGLPTSLRIDRRRGGERRLNTKRQAISRA